MVRGRSFVSIISSLHMQLLPQKHQWFMAIGHIPNKKSPPNTIPKPTNGCVHHHAASPSSHLATSPKHFCVTSPTPSTFPLSDFFTKSFSPTVDDGLIWRCCFYDGQWRRFALVIHIRWGGITMDGKGERKAWPIEGPLCCPIGANSGWMASSD